MSKFAKLSMENPLAQILMMLIAIILFLWILRMLNTTVGFGMNANVGRLRGSFSMEGFDDHANSKNPPQSTTKAGKR
jgi:hypothetical protein